MLNGANWQFKDITISTGQNAQLNLAAQTSFAHSYRWWDHSGTFEMGFKFTNNHQSQNSTENGYDSFGSTAPLMTQLLDDFSNTDYFNGTYFGGRYGQVSNFITAQDYTLAHYQRNHLQLRIARFCDGTKLRELIDLHTQASDLTQRTPEVTVPQAAALLRAIERSIIQAATGRAVPGAGGKPGDKVLVLVGHDTNLH